MNVDDLLSSTRDEVPKADRFDVNSFLNCETTQQEEMEAIDTDQSEKVTSSVENMQRSEEPDSTQSGTVILHDSDSVVHNTDSMRISSELVCDEHVTSNNGEKGYESPTVETNMVSESSLGGNANIVQNDADATQLLEDDSKSPGEQKLLINEEGSNSNDARQHVDSSTSNTEEWDIITDAECEEARDNDKVMKGNVDMVNIRDVDNTMSLKEVGESQFDAASMEEEETHATVRSQSERKVNKDDGTQNSDQLEKSAGTVDEQEASDRNTLDELCGGEISTDRLQTMEGIEADADSQQEMEEESNLPEKYATIAVLDGKSDNNEIVDDDVEQDNASRPSSAAKSVRGRGRPSRKCNVTEAAAEETDSREVGVRGSSRRRGRGANADDGGANGRAASSNEKENAGGEQSAEDYKDTPRRKESTPIAASIPRQSGRSSRPVRQSRSIPGSYIFGDEFVSDSPLVRKRQLEKKTTPNNNDNTNNSTGRKGASGKRRRVGDSESDREEDKVSDAEDKESSNDAGNISENVEDGEATRNVKLSAAKKDGKTHHTNIREKSEPRRKLTARAVTSKGSSAGNASALENNKKDLNENDSNVFDGLGFEDDNDLDNSTHKSDENTSTPASDASKLARKPLFSSHERSMGVKFNMKEMKFTLARARDIIRPPLDGKWKLDVDPKQEKQLIAKKMQDLRELERKLQAKEASAKQREQRLKQLDEEIDEKRMILKAQEAKYNQVMLSKERRVQMLEIKLHRQEHTLSMKEKMLENLEKQLSDHHDKLNDAENKQPEDTENKQPEVTENKQPEPEDAENKQPDDAEHTKSNDTQSEQAKHDAEDAQPNTSAVQPTDIDKNGEEDLLLDVDAADRMDTDGDTALLTENANGTDQANGTDPAVTGEEQDQASECKDWVERLTMLEKRLRQKDASLHNLEDTLYEMKARLSRRQRELDAFKGDLELKETELKTAEHQLAIRGSELAGHYRKLNERQLHIDLPVTNVPLISAGSVILLGSVDSMTLDEMVALQDEPVSYHHIAHSHSDQSDDDDDNDDDRANGFMMRERVYSKAASSSAADGRDDDLPPSSQGCDEETWLRIVGSSSPNKTPSSQREGSAARSLAADLAAESDNAADVDTVNEPSDVADAVMGESNTVDAVTESNNAADTVIDNADTQEDST